MHSTKALPGSAPSHAPQHVPDRVATDAADDAPLRVLFCLDSFHVGGTELNAVRTLERLVARGVEMEVACLRPEGPLLERVERAGVPVHEFRVPSLGSPRAVTQGMRFRSLVRRAAFDVVHAHDLYSNILLVPWARLSGSCAVIASRRWWSETPRAAHRVLNRWSYHFAHRVLVNSPAIGSLVESERIAPERIVVISNFVDDEAFESPGDALLQHLRTELALPPDAVVVGCVANLHPVKEHSVLLDCVSQLTNRWPRLRLVLVGDGPCRDGLEAQAQRLGIQQHVVFAGARPHHPSMHYLFDISVLASRAEGFPNAIVEAMAAGCAVVATAVGGVVDAVTHDQTGLLVPPSQPTAFAAALEVLLRDESARRRLGFAGRQRALQRYQAEHTIDALEALYTSIVRRRRNGR